MSVLNSFSTDARAAGAIGLTRIIQGHVHCQLVTHSAIQTIGAHGNNLHHVTGVGHQVLNNRPLVVKKRNIDIQILLCRPDFHWYLTYNVLVSISQVLLCGFIIATGRPIGDGVSLYARVVNGTRSLPDYKHTGVIMRVDLHVLWLWTANCDRKHTNTCY